MLDNPLLPHKTELISIAYEISPFRSFADLGGCWGVNGGYSFHARHIAGDAFTKGYVLDQTITPLTKKRLKGVDNLFPYEGLLGSQGAVEAVGEVDALIIFDVLLHQVNPDWDEFLRKWLNSANTAIIYNQNWIKTMDTVRFVDFGFEWYLQNVYFNDDEKKLRGWFDEHHQLNFEQGKPQRDIHNWWQFGIALTDLVRVARESGFSLRYLNSWNSYDNFPWIVDQGMIFTRTEIV